MLVDCITKPASAIALKSIMETLYSYLNTVTGFNITLTFDSDGIRIDETLQQTQISPLCGFHMEIGKEKFESYVFENISVDSESGEEINSPLSVKVQLSTLIESFKNFIKADILHLQVYTESDGMIMRLDRKGDVLKSRMLLKVIPVATQRIKYDTYEDSPISIDIKSFNVFCKTKITKRAGMVVNVEKVDNIVKIQQYESIDNTFYLYGKGQTSSNSHVHTKLHYNMLIKPTKFSSTCTHIDIFLEEGSMLKYRLNVCDFALFEIYITPVR